MDRMELLDFDGTRNGLLRSAALGFLFIEDAARDFGRFPAEFRRWSPIDTGLGSDNCLLTLTDRPTSGNSACLGRARSKTAHPTNASFPHAVGPISKGDVR